MREVRGTGMEAGARLGPRNVRNASYLPLCPAWPETASDYIFVPIILHLVSASKMSTFEDKYLYAHNRTSTGFIM